MSAELALPEFETLDLPAAMVRDLRSDLAGETGAVSIYRGMLANTADQDVLNFAEAHLQTEQKHLALLQNWLPDGCRSRVLPAWRLSGWMLGAVAARMGRTFTFVTIEAVETFVVAHYQAQIDKTTGPLRRLLVDLQADEAEHRDDACSRVKHMHIGHRIWAKLVHWGSAAAVVVARWI